jgi:hypothetical protein
VVTCRKVAKPEPGRLHGRAPYPSPPFDDEVTPSAGEFDDRQMIAPSAQMMLLYPGGSSEKDDFR